MKRNLFFYFFTFSFFLQIIVLAFLIFLHQVFLQRSDKILNIPDEMIVHKVDAWCSAQFLINHISSQFSITSFCP